MVPTFRVALGSFLVSLGAATAALIYGEISRSQQNSHHEEQRALAEEQLRLAREQAEMRPRLEVVCEVKRHRSSEKGTLQVEVTNTGRVAAHNVHGWIYFHKDFFGTPKLRSRTVSDLMEVAAGKAHRGTRFDDSAKPDEDGWYTAQIYENEELIVTARTSFDIKVTLKRTGKAPVRCRVVCNEGATFDDALEVEVPARS